MSALLEIRDLTVRFPTDDGIVQAVSDVSIDLAAGECLGIVGESGSGKSVTWLTVIGLNRGQTDVTGSVLLDGEELLGRTPTQMQQVRGKRIGMIFQDPMTSLHPYFKVGAQIAEAVRVHHDVSKKEAWARAVEMLEKVAIPTPAARAKQYPHEFSGGMRQRAMIAMALAVDPEILIADEPTTALDVTVQAQIMDLIQRLREEMGTAVVLITHDLGVVAEHCDRIAVMYAGRVVESGVADSIYAEPEHPYTWGLLASLPRLDAAVEDRLTPIVGTPPSMINPPSGCAFNPRCPHRFEPCTDQVPPLVFDGMHGSRCYLTPESRLQIRAEQRAGSA